jgi:hypothetical protein
MLTRRMKKGVNSLEAINIVNTPRIAARIYDLKKMGYKISSIKEYYHGRPSTRWYLLDKEQKA